MNGFEFYHTPVVVGHGFFPIETPVGHARDFTMTQTEKGRKMLHTSGWKNANNHNRHHAVSIRVQTGVCHKRDQR